MERDRETERERCAPQMGRAWNIDWILEMVVKVAGHALVAVASGQSHKVGNRLRLHLKGHTDDNKTFTCCTAHCFRNQWLRNIPSILWEERSANSGQARREARKRQGERATGRQRGSAKSK
jgi:hypothetical protein